MGSATADGLNLLQNLNRTGAEGDLDVDIAQDPVFDIDDIGDPIELPDGKRIYPPHFCGKPVHEIVCDLLDMQHPANSRFVALTGPPGTGKTQIARAVALTLWQRRGFSVIQRDGQPFYGLVEMSPGPSSDEHFFRYDYLPTADGGTTLVQSAFVDAMENGWTVVLDEPNIARDVALLSINATLDGRLSLYLPALNKTVVAVPGFSVILSYNPGLVGSTDIPQAWRSRFPATFDVRSNWGALLALGAPPALVAAARELDDKRVAGDSGLLWTPQFREIQGLVDMMGRCGERIGLALFISNIVERLDAGEVHAEELDAVVAMLDAAGYGGLKVLETSAFPNHAGYLKAVTSG